MKKKPPVTIVGTKRDTSTRFSDKEEYTIGKAACIVAAEDIHFPYNQSLSSHLQTDKKAQDGVVYNTVDLKVKVITKDEDKQIIVKNGVQRYKTECTVADQTESIKLILWEK